MKNFWHRVSPLRRAARTALLLIAVARLAPGATNASPQRLLAYYPFWARTQTPAYSAAQIPFEKLTHVFHSFLLLDAKADGGLSVNPGLNEPELISRAHGAGVKVLISVGGAMPGQEAAFAQVARDETSRRAFVRNVRAFVVARGYDGVDVDWEFPKAPQDTAACTLLVNALRDELPAPRWLLSMAVPANPAATGLDFAALTPMLDFVNVMTYDFHGPWSNHAGHNSPLTLSPDDPGREGSLATSVDLFLQRYKVPAEKLNVGTAFYGYEFEGVAHLWGECACESVTKPRGYGTFIKQRINKLGWKAYTDKKAAKAPYLLRQEAQSGPALVTYDDPASTARKVKYALGTWKLGGVFMWSLGADYDGVSQDLLDAMYRAYSHANRRAAE